MSEGGSPSLLNLRGFRIQRKPTLSFTPVHETELNSSIEVSPDFKIKRKLESDSEANKSADNMNMNMKKEQNIKSEAIKMQVKPIQILSPININQKMGNDPGASTNSNSNSNASNTPNSSDSTNKITVSSLFLSSRPKKSEEVIEKEKQMRFLRERYPTMESMAIHDTLSRHQFNIESAVLEIEKKVKEKEKRQMTTQDLSKQNDKDKKEVKPLPNNRDYALWKADLDKKESKPVIITPTVTITATQPVQTAHTPQNTVIHKKRTSTADVSLSTKKKVKRLRTEAVSDEDSDGGKDYKDRRVYNSDEDSDVEANNDLSGDKKKVFQFFQTATSADLQLMSSCSERKASSLIENRPFTDWVDLVNKLSGNRFLGKELLNSAQEVLRRRHNVKNLLLKCKNIAQQLERAVAASAGVQKQPALLSEARQLTSYQMIGLNWLAVLHAQGLNGILADEMGLGKTIQVIAFLAYLKETRPTKEAPHLIVVPSSTLDNWSQEFEKWCPSLKVFMYHGSIDERRGYRIEYWSKGRISEYDVILTTYSMIANSPEERKMFKVTQMHYVVFDEAHLLKNMHSQRYEHLIRIKAKNRILLTGTPLQNNLLELISLLVFVMPQIFAGRLDDLKSLFSKGFRGKQEGDQELPPFEKDQIKHAKDIMKPFVLRRLKEDVLKGLPKKTDELVKVPLASTQYEQYENLVCHFQNIGKESPEGGYSAMTMMTELRKLSNHPLLLKFFYQYDDINEMARLLAADSTYKENEVQYIIDDLAELSDFNIHMMCKLYPCLEKFQLPDNLILTSGKFLYLDRKLKELKEDGHRVLIFSQFVLILNIMEEYLRLRNYSYLRLDGNTAVNERQELIDKFTEDPSCFIFLLSTKAGGVGINLTAADTVIIHDIDFNPYNDKQAEDRCHRIGQTKPVSVYRLVSHCTIEEGMWQMNQEKLKLEKEVTAEENDNPDVKSVVRLLSSALGLDSSKVSNLVPTSTPGTQPFIKKS